jgi:hypothetical protein
MSMWRLSNTITVTVSISDPDDYVLWTKAAIDVVQGTVRSSQESAASARQLSILAEEQQRLVGQFRLE